MMVGMMSTDDVSIFLKSLGNKLWSLKKSHLLKFCDTLTIDPFELKTVHEMKEAFGLMGFNCNNLELKGDVI